MVSYQKLKHVVGDKLLVEAVCLSTDTKPTENIADSSKLTEQDTGKKYLFNGGTWYNVTDEMPIDIEEPTLITLTQDKEVNNHLISQIDGQCLSTDTKPTLNIANGSQMIEMDTSKVYFFDEANSQWREFGGDS